MTRVLKESVRMTIPSRPIAESQIRLPWIKGDVLTAVRKRNAAWKCYSNSRRPEHFNQYKTLRNQATTEIRAAHHNYEKQAVMNMKNKPKAF